MAEPIQEIRKKALTKEEEIDEKINRIKEKFSDQEAYFHQLLDIVDELGSMGALEAVKAMLIAKEDITNIGLEQLNREPVKNTFNVALAALGALAEIHPDQVKDLTKGLRSGLEAGHAATTEQQKVSMLDLFKALNDPEINRSITFLFHFLKGMGKELNKEME